MSLHLRTFKHHFLYMGLRAPVMALSTQFAAFVAIKSLGATESQAILVSYALPVGNLVAFFLPRLMARRLRIPFAFWPDLLGYLFLLPMVFVTDPRVFISLVFFTVVLRSSTIVALSGVIRENYPAALRGKTMGTVQAASLGAMALSGAMFGFLLEQDHGAYRYLFPLGAMLGIAAALQLRAIPEGDPTLRKGQSRYTLPDLVRILLKDRDFLRYEVSFFLFGFAALGFSALLPLYLAQELQVSYKSGAFALVVLLYGIPCITSPFWGALLDRFNMLFMRGVFNVVWAMCPLLIFAFGTIESVMVGQFLVGSIQGGSMLVWNLGINLFARREDVPVYMGIHQGLTGVRGLLAPMFGLQLAMFLAPAGAGVPAYRPVFLLFGVLMLTAGTFMIWEARQMSRKGRATTFALAEKDEV